MQSFKSVSEFRARSYFTRDGELRKKIGGRKDEYCRENSKISSSVLYHGICFCKVKKFNQWLNHVFISQIFFDGQRRAHKGINKAWLRHKNEQCHPYQFWIENVNESLMMADSGYDKYSLE
jgi:hypothetical protein